MATVHLIFIWWQITSRAAFHVYLYLYLYLYLIASAGQGKCIPDSSFVPSSSNRRRPLLHSLSLHILENLENWENRDSREKDYNDSEEKMIVERKMKWWKRTPPLLFSPHTKHCQGHNGPEGWVHLSKVTYWVVSQVQTQILIKLYLQNLDLALTSTKQELVSEWVSQSVSQWVTCIAKQ